MDWPRARAILLAALLLVNLVLAYAIWGPSGIFPELTGVPLRQQVQQVRATLLERGFDLTAQVPPTPGPMSFLRVEYKPTLVIPNGADEPSVKPIPAREAVEQGPSLEPATQAVVYRPRASGRATRELKLDNEAQVKAEVQQYLQAERLLPGDAMYTGYYPQAASGTAILEYVPSFQGHPVFSGYLRAEVSSRGIESVTLLWVQPRGFKEAPPKAVRAASEAVLRLVGHLERTGGTRQVVSDIRLGYYAGRSLTALQAGAVNGWDTVPVWRIRLSDGAVYFINAFNGELES